MKKKKLQVFVSSTYKDLVEERQTAVLSILSSGHIPAGMELFTAGDESQWNVIKRWIEESDVFLLILGGRYGSVEQNSGKSYIQLEYEYAIKLNKPYFAIVITEEALESKIKLFGSATIEKENPQKLKEFRAVVLSKLVKFFNDLKDIKLAIYETMSEFIIRDELIGWVRSNDSINSDQVAEQLSLLSKENQELRKRIKTQTIENPSIGQLYNGINYEELISVLSIQKMSKSIPGNQNNTRLNEIKKRLGFEDPNLLVFVLAYLDKLLERKLSLLDNIEKSNAEKLELLGLVEFYNSGYGFNKIGKMFYFKLLINYSEYLNVN